MMQKAFLFFLITFLTLTGAENLLTSCKNSEPEIAKSSEKGISLLKIGTFANADVVFDPAINIYTFTVPFSANVSAVPITFSLPAGASSSPISGSIQNLTNPVTYTITAEDGSKMGVTIKIIKKTPSNEAKIISFKLKDMPFTVKYEINDQYKLVLAGIPVDAGKSLTSLVPIFTLSEGATINPGSEIIKDFSQPNSPITYTVTAEDGVTKTEYKVTAYYTYDEYYTFYVDGVVKKIVNPDSYDYYPTYQDGTTSKFYTTGIYNQISPDVDVKLQISLEGVSEQALSTANGPKPVPLNYTVAYNNAVPVRVYMFYSLANGEVFASYTYSTSDAGKITFTRIDSYYLEGTFEGFVKNASGKIQKISNGKFKVFRSKY